MGMLAKWPSLMAQLPLPPVIWMVKVPESRLLAALRELSMPGKENEKFTGSMSSGCAGEFSHGASLWHLQGVTLFCGKLGIGASYNRKKASM
jgi:hypothetical protein